METLTRGRPKVRHIPSTKIGIVPPHEMAAVHF